GDAVRHLELRPEIERDGCDVADRAATLVDLAPASVDESAPRRPERLDRRGDGARKVVVVGVDPGEDLPAREPEALVESRRLTAVRLGEPLQVCEAVEDPK